MKHQPLSRSLRSSALLASLFAAGLLAACSNKYSNAQVSECNFPDAPNKAAPLWVCTETLEGYQATAMGSHAKSKAGYNFMQQHAATAARVKLAQQIKTQVQNLVKQYAETTGEGESETVDQVYTSVTSQITNESLRGTRIVRSITSPSGSLYVLVGVSKSNFIQEAKSALKTSMNNDKALWQMFRAKQGQEDLKKAILGQDLPKQEPAK